MSQRAPVVGLVHTLLGLPGQTVLVGQNTSSQGTSVVATPSDQHDTMLGYDGGRLESKLVRVGGDSDALANHLDVILGVVVMGSDTVFLIHGVRAALRMWTKGKEHENS